MRKMLAVSAVLAIMMCAGLASRAQEATSETIETPMPQKKPTAKLTGRCTPTGSISQSTNWKMGRRSTRDNIR